MGKRRRALHTKFGQVEYAQLALQHRMPELALTNQRNPEERRGIEGALSGLRVLAREVSD